MSMTAYMALLAANQPWNLILFMVIPVACAETLVASEFFVLYGKATHGDAAQSTFAEKLTKYLGFFLAIYYACLVVYLLVAVVPGIEWQGPIDILAIAFFFLAFIPAVLRAYYNVNEVCTTILMNTVALYITSYLVSGPMSAGTANAQSLPVTVRLYQFMKPSSVNVGIFIAAITVIVIIFMLQKSSWGYKIRTVGLNPTHADYVGIDSKKVFIGAMMLSGMLGGMAGCIEVLGVHGYFLNNFATGLGSNGMLAALIVKNNMVSTPFMAFFLAVLKSGAMGMQQSTGVPKSLVDTITAVFIIIATMETAFQFTKKRKKKTEEKKEDKA